MGGRQIHFEVKKKKEGKKGILLAYLGKNN